MIRLYRAVAYIRKFKTDCIAIEALIELFRSELRPMEGKREPNLRA